LIEREGIGSFSFFLSFFLSFFFFIFFWVAFRKLGEAGWEVSSDLK